MKRKLLFGLSITTLMLASCGGSGEEGSEESADSTAVEEVVVEPITYSVDTTSEFAWTAYDAGEPGHTGSVKAASGSITVEGDHITAGTIEFDMNTLVADAEKLTAHLGGEDFFNLAGFATSSFTMEKHEEGIVYGTLSVIGMDVAVEAPVSINVSADSEILTVIASEFKINMAGMPYFKAEVDENVPEEERHDPNIGVTATVTGTK